MVVTLIVIASLAGLAGAAMTTQATLGVSLVAAACLLAILVRIAQASGHHAARKRRVPHVRRLVIDTAWR